MATYVYETVPARPGDEIRRFEIRQGMTEEALTRHPETGEPIRRVITGGTGFISSGKPSGSPTSGRGGGCHGGGCGCHGG